MKKKQCLFLVTVFCLTAHGSNKLGCPNKSEAISYSPGPALKVWQLDGSMGGTVYVCLHLSKKWTKCRCIKTIHYMDPMDLLTWLFVTCWFYVFFGQNKFRTVFPANEAQGKVGGTTIPLNTFNCMSNLKYLEEELDDSQVKIYRSFLPWPIRKYLPRLFQDTHLNLN